MAVDAALNGNTIRLTITHDRATFSLDFSLQRHHYRHCATAGALVLNSLLYSMVTDQDCVADAQALGADIEALLDKENAKKKYDLANLYAKQFSLKARGRTYMVDNVAMIPQQPVNHFFVVSGANVWGGMTQNQYVAARDLRRVEEAIVAKGSKAEHTTIDYVKKHRLAPGSLLNPVWVSYNAARTSFALVPGGDDANLGKVSGKDKIVKVIRAL